MGCFTVPAWLDYAGAPEAPAHTTVAEAAAGELGPRAWVILDDARFHPEKAVEVVDHKVATRFVPVTGASGEATIFAQGEVRTEGAGLAATGRLERCEPSTASQLSPAGNAPPAVFKLVIGWTPSDDRLLAVLMSVASLAFFPLYPLFLFARRVKPEEKIYEPCSSVDARIEGLVCLLLGGVFLYETARDRPAGTIGPALGIALGLFLIVFGHTDWLRLLLFELDWFARESGPRAPSPLPPSIVTPDASAHVLETELVAPPPRPIPRSVRRGPHARAWLRYWIVFATIGLVLLVGGASGVLARVAIHFWPLAWSTWIGVGMIALAALAFLGDDRAHYVRDGVPIPARIESIEKVAVRLGPVVVQWVYRVTLALRHPVTGEPCLRAVESDPVAAKQMPRLAVGETRTAIYLPRDFENTLTLYGFSRLTDESDIFSGSQES